jgi:hypothetical protein
MEFFVNELGRNRRGTWEKSSGNLGEIVGELGRNRRGTWEKSSGNLGEIVGELGRNIFDFLPIIYKIFL